MTVEVGKEYITSVSNASMNMYNKLRSQFSKKLFKCPCYIKVNEKVTVTDLLENGFALVRFNNSISVVAIKDLIEVDS